MRSVIIMFSGMPGTGKSTAAEKLAQFLGYSLASLLGTRQSRGYKRHRAKRMRSDMKELLDRVFRALLAKEDMILDSASPPESLRLYISIWLRI